MTYAEAMNLIDGIDIPEDEDDYDEAWRTLCDSGWIYQLPGRYGRAAEALGYI